MQAPVEICYAGVVIARAEEVREGEGGEFFIVMKDPLPVGTLLGVRSADSLVSARVLRVVESADPTASGMQVRPAGSDDAGTAIWIPPPPAAKPGSAQAAAATQATAAVEPPAAEEPAPAQAVPVEAAAASASESPAAAPIEEPAPDDRSAREAVEREVPAAAIPEPVAPAERAVDEVSVAKEQQPTSAEAIPAESAAPADSTDSAAVPEAVPVAVGSSLTGALQGAVASQLEATSGAVKTSGESSAPGDEA
jgi:hypothetical protein